MVGLIFCNECGILVTVEKGCSGCGAKFVEIDENAKVCSVPSCETLLTKNEHGICSKCDEVARHPSVTKPWTGR